MVVSVGERVLGSGRRAAGEVDEMARRNAFPEIAETAPAGNAMEVREDLNPRESQELRPGEFKRLPDQAKDAEAPGFKVKLRRPGGVQNRPFLCARLARRDAVLPIHIGTDDGSLGSVSRGEDCFGLVFLVIHPAGYPSSSHYRTGQAAR